MNILELKNWADNMAKKDVTQLITEGGKSHRVTKILSIVKDISKRCHEINIRTNQNDASLTQIESYFKLLTDYGIMPYQAEGKKISEQPKIEEVKKEGFFSKK